MSDERKEGVNLLTPETVALEREASFEAQEQSRDFAPRRDQTPRVDKSRLTNVKASISAQAVSTQAVQKDPVLTQIEGILAENLGEIYAQLPEDKREAFKVKGEQVARTIQEMMTTAKVKVHKILKMLSEWLGMIPGVNVYFLQQEAKIKLDKVMDYVEEQTKKSENTL